MTDINKKTTKSNTKQPGGRQLSLIICCSLLVVALTASVGFADFAELTYLDDDETTIIYVTPKPWLAGVTTSSVYACVIATTEANATVKYWLTTDTVSSADTENTESTGSSIDATTNSTYVHNVRLAGLLPNTEYNYQVTHVGDTSAVYTFRTAPLPGTPATFGFAADSRTYPITHNAVAANMISKNPNMMIYGGDLVGSTWAKDWFGVDNQATLNAKAPFVNAAGNHEGWGTNTRAFTESPSGTDGDGSGTASDGKGFFSYDYGDVHILVLNNEIDESKDSAQWDFAKNDLETSNAKFKIVAFHEPAVTYGSHGSDEKMLNMTTDIFELNDVDFVMAGHNHFYQHCFKDGIHHMVIGSMGVNLSSPDDGEFVVRSERTECFAIFDTDGGNTLTLKTYRGLEGTLIEIIEVAAYANNTNDCDYSETEAREIGDTNYDCKINLADFAVIALNWMTDKTN